MAAAQRLHIFHGPDGFSAREAVRELRSRLGVADANVVRLEGTAPVSEIASAAHTATFFAEPRLVIIDSLSKRLEGRRRGGRPRRGGSSGAASELDQLVELLSNLPETTTVVLLEEAPSAGFIDTFKGIASVRHFPIKRGQEMRRWAEARVEAQGGKISAAALDRLCELVDGAHLGELAQEVDKLLAYVGGRRIEVEDVEEVGSGAVSHQTWDLTDAVVAGQADSALRVLRRMDEKQHPPQLLLSMLVRQYRQILLAQELLREGLSAPQIGERLGIAHAFPLGKVIDQASRYPAENLERAFRRLLEADVAVKTGVMDIETALDLLIVDLAQIAGAGRRGFGSRRPG
ncbi:MAG TPA: DNA polymerase III subunit delta [Dehalococcoidia bacterium]|nr:DNA polymerase III subunit delta [Dehalococcoidia bacterium]